MISRNSPSVCAGWSRFPYGVVTSKLGTTSRQNGAGLRTPSAAIVAVGSPSPSAAIAPPAGSKSTSNTRRPAKAVVAARLMAAVVFPTPARTGQEQFGHADPLSEILGQSPECAAKVCRLRWLHGVLIMNPSRQPHMENPAELAPPIPPIPHNRFPRFDRLWRRSVQCRIAWKSRQVRKDWRITDRSGS